MMLYSPYWQEIRPYVTHGDDGYHQLAKNAPKDIEEKFWKHEADAADGLGIEWVKENIPDEYRYIIENRQKFNW